MVNPLDVQPRRWTNLRVLSDDGDFAYAYGVYRHDNGIGALELAGRWNGDSNNTCVGFPSQGGNPVWFVLDSSMIGPILAELEARAVKNGNFAAAAKIFKAREDFRV